MNSILLVPISPVEGRILESLPAALARVFACPVEIEDSAPLDPTFAFDASRNQFNSTKLLASLLDRFPNLGGKVLGVTVADLFIPVLTYVFGEAQLGGPAAIVSTYRLDDSLYGLPENEELLRERSLKEAVHELGHTFGLYHCTNFECVMHSSTAAEEIDLKRDEFCPRCRTKMSR
jgi:archaemetzincin